MAAFSELAFVRATCFVKAPFRNAVTYGLVRSLLRKGLFRASHLNESVSQQAFFNSGAPPRSRRGKSPPKGTLAGHKATKARGGRPLRACFDFNLSSLSRARKICCAQPKNFSALFLDKTDAGTSYKRKAWEREGVTPSQGVSDYISFARVVRSHHFARGRGCISFGVWSGWGAGAGCAGCAVRCPSVCPQRRAGRAVRI